MVDPGSPQAQRPRAAHGAHRLPAPVPTPLAAAFAAAVALALCLWPAISSAAEAIYLTWNDCPLGATASNNRAFACNTDLGQDELICAFTMPQAVDNVIAVEIVVDIQHASSPMPSWWQFQQGGCRPAASITAAADFSGLVACTDMWGAAMRTAQVQGYISTEPYGQDSQARIKATAQVLPQDAVSLNATSMYYAARIIINHSGTVSPACGGCSEAACLVLNSILIGRFPDPSIFLQVPGTGEQNWARWQGGVGANCAAVPVRNRAWGQLKSQYR